MLVQLDKERTFKYGMRALDRLEKRLQKPVTKLDMKGMSMDEIATFVWAGLVHEDPALTPNKVMELIDDHSNIGVVMEAAGNALQQAFGIEKKEDDGDEKNG